MHPILRLIKRWMGALLGEALVYAHWLLQRKNAPSLVIFPSHNKHMGSSNLRAYQVGAQLRALGWRVIVASSTLRLAQRQRLLRIVRPQVLVLQKARHPDNRPGLYAEFPCLFDLDDADFLDDQSRPGILECVQGSVLTIAGSELVARWCRDHHGKAEVVWTGSPVTPSPLRPQRDRSLVLVWGASMPHGYPAEADFLQRVIQLVSRDAGRIPLKLYADDGSEQYRNMVRAFELAGADVHPTPHLGYADYLASLEECAIGLAPLVEVDGYSGGKSFGKVLAYLDRGVPVLTHPVVDHPRFFQHGVNGLMAWSAEEWAEHIVRLMRDAGERQRLADNGHSSFRSELSMEVMACKMDRLLREVIAVQEERPLMV